MKTTFALAIATALLAGCSSQDDAAAPTEDVVPAEPSAAEASATPADSASPALSARTLTLEGLGALEIGKPLPAGGSWRSGGDMMGGNCATASSREFPGVHALTIDGEVRRISVSRDSDVTLVEGIGAGASEAEVTAAFPGFRAEPHKYVAAPAKYLFQPGDDPRLMFEMGADGRVQHVHVGRMPQLGYVEGCA